MERKDLDSLRGKLKMVNFMKILKESSYYHVIRDEALKEGRTKGRKEGRKEGVHKGHVAEARKLILRVGKSRFGAPPARVRNAVESIDDLTRLERMSDRILASSSWDELVDET
jgi:predicted transposase YdaD